MSVAVFQRVPKVSHGHTRCQSLPWSKLYCFCVFFIYLSTSDDLLCQTADIVYCLYLYRFLKGSAAEEACAAVASAVGSNPLLMTELDLSKLIPEALGVTQLCALLEDSHCTLQKLRLVDALTLSSINIH